VQREVNLLRGSTGGRRTSEEREAWARHLPDRDQISASSTWCMGEGGEESFGEGHLYPVWKEGGDH